MSTLKRKQPEGVDVAHAWLDEAASQFLDGSVSARRLQRLVAKAQQAVAKGAEAIVRTGQSGKSPQNVCRDMMRTLKKNSLWTHLLCQYPILGFKEGVHSGEVAPIFATS